MVSNTLNKVDCLLSGFGVIFGIAIISLYSMSPTIYIFSIGMALALSCSLYLIITHVQFSIHPQQNLSRKWKTVLDISFLLLFILSLIILHNSDYRPLSYFLIYSLCVGSVAVSVFFSTHKLDYLIQYSKIIFLSFNINYSIFNLAGLIPGVDTWGHAKMNYLLSQTGNIGVLFDKEMYFPVMHIQTAIMNIVSNTSLKDASNFAIIVPFVLASSFVYLLSKNFFGDKVGLFAMLLVSASDFNIYWGSAPQTTSYGIILYYLLVYILVKTYFLKPNPKFVALSIFFIITLTITHAVSSFIFVITMLGVFFGSRFYSFIYEKKTTSIFRDISLVSVIALLQWWFIALYSKGGKSFFDVIASTFYYYITGSADFLHRPETVSTISAMLPPFYERFANTFGLIMFLFFGIIGSLFCLSPKYRNKVNFIFIFSLTVLFSITFVFPLFGLRNILPTRWFSFEYFFLSILASFSIFRLTAYFKSVRVRSIFIAVVFISFSFFMSVSTISNLDSPLWLKNDTVSTTFTLEEVRGAETLFKFGTNFIADSSFGSLTVDPYINQKPNITIFSPSMRLNHGEIFLWRSYMEKRPIEYFTRLVGYEPVSSYIVLGSTFHSNLSQYDKIYDNKDLSAYYISQP